MHENKVRVWDWPVRIAHWGLVLAFSGAYVTNRLGVNYFKYHAWFGYTALVLAVFRILWGFAGTHHARFVSFVRGPIETARYTLKWVRGEEQGYPGHNPLGAWMVIALLAAMTFQAATGLFANDDIFNVGPFYGYVSNEFSLQLTSWHRRFFYWIAGAVGFHVIAVLIHVVFKKEPLIGAMFTGHKPNQQRAEAQSTLSRLRGALALTIAALCISGLAWAIATAPQAEMSFE